MSQPVVRLPDVTRNALAAARALTIGLRAWNLYPPEHPALALAVDRLVLVTTEATQHGPLMLAVTPHNLMVDGCALDSPDASVTECARLLHDLDILQLAFVAPAPDDAVRELLATLTIERGERRKRGGPAALWSERGHPSIVVEQIDYQELLEREADQGPARRDVLWQSIVRSIVAGRRTFTEAEQQRLLEVSRDAWAVGELADDCRSAYSTADGSPLLTTQAATVLAVYRHIAATVGVLEPDRAGEVMKNFALSTSALEPSLAFEVLNLEDGGDSPQPIMKALKQTFDDQQIALLLARSLAKAGRATGRLSQILDTLAPDAERRTRVLRLADKLLTERDFGATRPITDIRASLEELLLKYDETHYVSGDYRQSMDSASDRAAELAIRDLPPEITEWVATLGHENVRDLSGQLLIDLLGLETTPERASEIAKDMSTFAEDLLLAGAYREAQRMVAALRAFMTKPQSIAPESALRAIETVGRASGLVDAMGLLGELSTEDTAAVAALCREIGGPVVAAVVRAFSREDAGLQGQRAAAILTSLGSGAIHDMAHGIEDRKWYVQRELAQVLGVIGTAAAVPPLQVLLRRPDRRVLRAVVTALSGIDDPSAARALHTVLRASSGEARDAVVQSMVAMRDPRVVPILGRILDESDVLGRDFELVLDAINAIASFRDDRAIRPITTVAQQRRWLAYGRTGRMRERAVRALEALETPAAVSALDHLQKNGDWHLRRITRAARSGATA
ncbi:MAG TPA: HEAT repeat domain-containing protein [Vicinamibacterales bacterium]|nr:HEAT repeat domain-containing protein [Vicinamibacterales bacterium]